MVSDVVGNIRYGSIRPMGWCCRTIRLDLSMAMARCSRCPPGCWIGYDSAPDIVEVTCVRYPGRCAITRFHRRHGCSVSLFPIVVHVNNSSHTQGYIAIKGWTWKCLPQPCDLEHVDRREQPIRSLGILVGIDMSIDHCYRLLCILPKRTTRESFT